jgi:ABC-2 type transport system permease protein
MSKILTVARREYLERVRSRAFLIGTVLGPLIMAAVILLPGLVMSKQRGKAVRLVVLDETESLGPVVEAALRERVEKGSHRFDVRPVGEGPREGRREALRERVVNGELDGFLVLPRDALERSAVEYYGKNVSSMTDLGALDRVVEDALIGQRLAAAGLERERVGSLIRKVDLKTIRITAQGMREDRGATFILSFVLLSLLYTSLAIWGSAIMNNVIEEKTNRVVEVVVSSLPASRLFAGKLLGVGSAGLTQFLIWGLTLAVISAYGAAMAATAGLPFPELSAPVLGCFVLFFVLGYFFYGALYAAIGASVNTQQEAQSLAFLVVMPLAMGFAFCVPVLSNPDGALAVTLSLLPPLTPLLMFLRASTVMPPLWQLALSVVLMLASITFVNWAAARIYRVGILMYGKKPTLPEMLRWIKQSAT